jgi:hypothetical protein
MRSADGSALSDDGGGGSRADEAGVLVVEEQVLSLLALPVQK